jgi:membrane-associated HD superfamily phosphohydrolase
MKTFLKALISGFLLWAIMFDLMFLSSGIYNQYDLIKILIPILSGVMAVLFVNYLKVKNIKQASVYSIVWLSIVLFFDYFVTVKFVDQTFNYIYFWLDYGLVFISPLIYVSLLKKKSIWKK